MEQKKEKKKGTRFCECIWVKEVALHSMYLQIRLLEAYEIFRSNEFKRYFYIRANEMLNF